MTSVSSEHALPATHIVIQRFGNRNRQGPTDGEHRQHGGGRLPRQVLRSAEGVEGQAFIGDGAVQALQCRNLQDNSPFLVKEDDSSHCEDQVD